MIITLVLFAEKNESRLLTAPIIGDSLFMNFCRTFSIRDVLRLKQTSKTITDLVFSNIVIAEQARWQDNMDDWYFPLLLEESTNSPYTGANYASNTASWSGVHHSSGSVHSLPGLTSHIPESFDRSPFCIVGSSGGLVLLHTGVWLAYDGYRLFI